MKTVPKEFPDKTVDEEKIYAFDFRRALGTDTIASATWASQPAGLTFASDSLSSDNTKTNVTISGGSAGQTYVVTCKAVTTTSGETYEARAELYVRRTDED